MPSVQNITKEKKGFWPVEIKDLKGYSIDYIMKIEEDMEFMSMKSFQMFQEVKPMPENRTEALKDQNLFSGILDKTSYETNTALS